MPAHELLSVIPPTRRRILLALKRNGEARSEDLAAEVDISVSAVRQQMLTLVAEGLVERREVAGGQGRPKLFFRLSAAGEAVFPSAYVSFGAPLLAELARTAPVQLEAALEHGLEDWSAFISEELATFPPRQALAAFAHHTEAAGFLQSIEDTPGTCTVSVFNCPLLQFARILPRLCELHASALAQAARVPTVQQTSSMLDRGPHCDFTIRMPEGAALLRPARRPVIAG